MRTAQLGFLTSVALLLSTLAHPGLAVASVSCSAWSQPIATLTEICVPTSRRSRR